ncbi:hypothetical protein E2P81_ATG03010 [Venturia nashicola]|uniref:Uncharacterized protein n=1 Tax=Venturia nashicola TaxID=86259 RepID=A0A4Z1P6R3_9PEZI|nr:hypothetical protein E6O75_ATG03074 [Venturia nashicola]TLD36121.1 hypothetical protein E2P81_ATG03010 [Venturia nashicola]
MSSTFSFTSTITPEPMVASISGTHSEQHQIETLQLDVPASQGHEPMDGEVLITCHDCGNGPFVGAHAPACTSCGHEWKYCNYCEIRE